MEPQVLSWGPNIINILGMKQSNWWISIIPDNILSLTQITWPSYRSVVPTNPDVFLPTFLRLRNTVLTWHGCREVLSVGNIACAFLY